MTDTYKPVPLPDRVEKPEGEMRAAAEEFLAQMQKRHTVRDFSSHDVPQDVIEACIATAGLAPSGANHQPWHFALIRNTQMKADIRAAAEEEEERFYAGGAGDAWLEALEPIGTGVSKPHLDVAPWLIVVFAQRYGMLPDGTQFKHYYVPESTGIAAGFLIAALHNAGLVCLTHTPAPMNFLRDICQRPKHEKPIMILAVGHAASDATVPQKAKEKKPLGEIMSIFG